MAKFFNMPPIHNWRQKISYDANDLEEYIGYAPAHAKTSDAKWQLQKLVYNANSQVTDIIWADGNDKFDKIFDDRTSYTYSTT